MKNILLILAFLIGGFDAYGATPSRGNARGSTGSTSQSVGSTSGNSAGIVGARAAKTTAVRGRSATTPTAATTNNTKTTVSRGRSATTPTTSTVKARAGTKQNVINSGTKVATATQNTVVDEECWNKFSGCMDSFCMLDNATGGRCICSDKNAEYDSILAEIQDLDNQSYQMATVGVERIEMGDDADAVMAKTKSITSSIEKDADKEKSKRRALDLSTWNNDSDSGFEEEVEDIFSLSADGVSVANKKGDALYRASVKLCTAQIPECSNQNKMMELMYQQRIRSDCSAYENSLRQQRTQSAQKLAAAQSAMREAALEQYRNANKYDLGQCTIEFKKCMQTTGGCGDDFTGCVTQQTTRETLQGGKMKMKKIKGASTSIEIAAWTYDALESKKPLCMTVTQQCVNVKNQVWDTFLREVAPQVKSAELAAESNLRTSCISTISDCFQKACKENMDPNNPDGSYDMCLTRPETLRSFCKVEIDPCEAAEPKIMDYVRARLASMRVDACTKEFKECLQSEDRCGADYTQCIGLDTDTIVRLCPAEKLVGCQYDDDGSDGSARTNKSAKVKTDEEIYDELARIAQGIFLGIDNNLLSSCQKAVQSKVLEVCGSLSDCDAFDEDTVMGTDSLVTYKKGDQIIIDGLMNFGLLKSKETTKDGKVAYSLDKSQFKFNNKDAWNETDESTLTRIKAAIQTVENSISQKMDTLQTDPTIDMCINGRSGDWRYSRTGKQDKSQDKMARFPNLLDSYSKMLFSSGLKKAYLNYRAKYDELVGNALEDQSDDIKSALCAAMSYSGEKVCTKSVTVTSTLTQKKTNICTEWGTKGLESIFNDTSGDTGIRNNGTQYVLQSADLTKKLQTMSKGKGEFIQTDGDGNMVASISMTSTYSPTTNICTVTTTSLLCSDIDTIITTDTEKCSGAGIATACAYGDGDVGLTGGSVSGNTSVSGIGYSQSTTTKENFHGIYCTSYAEPVIETREIKL